MRKRRIIFGTVVGAAIIVAAVIGRDTLRDPKDPVAARVTAGSYGWVTAVGYPREGPYPKSKGNCFTIRIDRWFGPGRNYHVANMDFENYQRIVKDEKLDEIDVLLFGKGTCLIVDPRIPRSWRRDPECVCGACCRTDYLGDYLLEAYPNEFREKK